MSLPGKHEDRVSPKGYLGKPTERSGIIGAKNKYKGKNINIHLYINNSTFLIV